MQRMARRAATSALALPALALVACTNVEPIPAEAVYETTLEELPLSAPVYLDTHLLLRRADGQPHLGGDRDDVEAAPAPALTSVAERSDYGVCGVHTDDGCRSRRGTYVAMSEITRLPNGQLELGVAERTVVEEGGATSGRTWIVRLEDDGSPRVISKTLVYAWDAG